MALSEVQEHVTWHSPVHTITSGETGTLLTDDVEGVGFDWLLESFARAGVRRTACSLPVPGDLFGLAGPPPLNRAALDAGEVLLGLGERPGEVLLAAVPVTIGAGTQWFVHRAAPRPPADLGEADRELRRAVPASADRLAALDIASWSPDAVDGLLNLDHARDFPHPPGVPARAVTLAARADLVLEIIDVATADGTGGSVSATEAMLREDVLVDLARVARRALVASCSADAWPPV